MLVVFQAHQKAVEEELIAKQDRALKMKLESEMRELQKVRDFGRVSFQTYLNFVKNVVHSAVK